MYRTVHDGRSRVVPRLSVGAKRGCGAALKHLAFHHPYLVRVRSNGAGSRKQGARSMGQLNTAPSERSNASWAPPYLCCSRVNAYKSGMTESQQLQATQD